MSILYPLIAGALSFGITTIALREIRRYKLLRYKPVDPVDWPMYLGTMGREGASHAFAALGGDMDVFLMGWDARWDMGCPYPAGTYGAHCWQQGLRAFNRHWRFGAGIPAEGARTMVVLDKRSNYAGPVQ